MTMRVVKIRSVRIIDRFFLRQDMILYRPVWSQWCLQNKMDVWLRRELWGYIRNQAYHMIWEHSVQLSVQGFFSGWVSSLSFSLSLWGFTSHCSASKSVRTFVVVMETDIKRWLDCCWNKDWMGQSREGSYERDNLLYQGDVLRN